MTYNLDENGAVSNMVTSLGATIERHGQSLFVLLALFVSVTFLFNWIQKIIFGFVERLGRRSYDGGWKGALGFGPNAVQSPAMDHWQATVIDRMRGIRAREFNSRLDQMDERWIKDFGEQFEEERSSRRRHLR